MSLNDTIRFMFSVAFIVLAAVSIGAFIEGSNNPIAYEWGAAIMVALGVGVGLWTLAEWRRSRNKDGGDE
jgi:hypothetical protein